MPSAFGPDLSFIYAGIAVLLAAVCYGCKFLEQPNRWYGVRTKWTLADERVWLEVNARFARQGAATSLVLAVLFALAGLWQARTQPPAPVSLLIAVAEAILLVTAMLVLALLAASDSRRTWRRYHEGDG